jgi:hypothetical protein
MKDSTIWVGIDDHADSVKVSVFASSSSEPVERFELVPDERGLRQLARRLKALGADLRCVYEAGPCGYELYRYLRGRGIGCDVATPALTPRRPGQKVKDGSARRGQAGAFSSSRRADADPGSRRRSGGVARSSASPGGRQGGSAAPASPSEQVSSASWASRPPGAELDTAALGLYPVDPLR